jgi:hypothetical protein
MIFSKVKTFFKMLNILIQHILISNHQRIIVGVALI